MYNVDVRTSVVSFKIVKIGAGFSCAGFLADFFADSRVQYEAFNEAGTLSNQSLPCHDQCCCFIRLGHSK